MSQESAPDITKVAADVIVKLIESAISAATTPAQVAGRRALQAVSNAYRPYLESTFQRVRTIRTFLKPNESVDLLEHYVPASLIVEDDKTVSADDMIAKLLRNERIVVSGTAGRGKSVLLRFVSLSLYHSPRGKIPLFLELRGLNQTGSKEILQTLHSQYKGRSNVRYEDFVNALRKGYFALILDGFDEIEPDSRATIETQIIDIAHQFDKCPIIVSGRPDERFNSWEQFKIFSVAPMTRYKTRLLIQKADYDSGVKKAFLKRLTPEFFAQHRSFLSNPLLAIMLMLTFEDYAEIPTTLHVFYRNAFDTLVRRHDAMKSQFLRTMHSGCSAEEFRKLFSSFCLITYSKSKFQFHEGEVLKFLDLSLTQQGIGSDKGHVLADLIESVCLLQREGFEISFVHRSFQEYFCALFISQAPAGMVERYLDSGKFRVSDSVLPMLYDMVPERVEAEWVEARIPKLLEMANKDDPEMSFLLAMHTSLELIFLRKNYVITYFNETPVSRDVGILRRLYPALLPDINAIPELSRAEEEAWRRKTEDTLRAREAAGDVRFEGLGEKFEEAERRGEGEALPRMSIPLSGDDRELTDLYRYYDHTYGVLDQLNVLQTQVHDRVQAGDTFLRDVFTP